MLVKPVTEHPNPVPYKFAKKSHNLGMKQKFIKFEVLI